MPLTRGLPCARPAARAGLTVWLAVPNRSVRLTAGALRRSMLRVGDVHRSKNPDEIHSSGFLFWRRPTLARPVAVLPSGLQRFTAVFGMGTGGATALVSPDVCIE